MMHRPRLLSVGWLSFGLGRAVAYSLALLLGLSVLPAAAQSYPAILCAGLNDSSGVDGGTSVGDCDLDGNFIQQSLTSTTFGQFTGLARAVSDVFGHVGLLASAQFVGYGPGAFVPAPWGINFAASASALFTDYLGVLAPYPEVLLVFSFDLSGTLTPPAIAAGQLCYGLTYASPPQPGECVTELQPTLQLLSQPFVPDGTLHELFFDFMAVVFIKDDLVPAPYTTAAFADLEHTIRMAELLVVLPDGSPARSVSLTSNIGFDYPLSPLNTQPVAVPEPGSLALLLPGLVVLPLLARRRSR